VLSFSSGNGPPFPTPSPDEGARSALLRSAAQLEGGTRISSCKRSVMRVAWGWQEPRGGRQRVWPRVGLRLCRSLRLGAAVAMEIAKAEERARDVAGWKLSKEERSMPFFLRRLPVCINTKRLLQIAGEQQLITVFNKSIVQPCLALFFPSPTL